MADPPEGDGRVYGAQAHARDAADADARVRLLRAPDAPEAFTLRLRPPRVCGASDGALLGGGNRKLGGVFFEVRAASAGDGPLCDTPDARWFQMSSETPEVCAVVAVNSQGCDGCVGPRYGHQAARLLRDGVCTVHVEAAALDHGRGIRRRVSAEFYGVENFAAVFPTAE